MSNALPGAGGVVPPLISTYTTAIFDTGPCGENEPILSKPGCTRTSYVSLSVKLDFIIIPYIIDDTGPNVQSTSLIFLYSMRY